MLDRKIKKVFRSVVVNKSYKDNTVFQSYNLPSYVKDWLIQIHTHDDTGVNLESLNEFLQMYIKDHNELLRLKHDLMCNESVSIYGRIFVEADIKKDMFKFSFPEGNIKKNEGCVPHHVIEKFPEVREEVTGLFKFVFNTSTIDLIDFLPIKPYQLSLQDYKNSRKFFSINEWIDVLVKSAEYNPEGFDSIEQKVLFLSRLLVFLEPNLNMIELAPKGTGKSFVFGNLSRHGWLISGGAVSRAKLFFDVSKNTPGLISRHDFIALDEIQTIRFSSEAEIAGAFKSYLENGTFSIGNYRQTSRAGLVILGNIPLTRQKLPKLQNYFDNLPSMFKETALLDRFHGFIEGWKLPRINESLKVKGFALSIDYFSEVMHKLRNDSVIGKVVQEKLLIPKDADTRDVQAIKRLCIAYTKLFFPHATDVSDISSDEFLTYCLNPAKEMRLLIRKQLNMMDAEYEAYIPDIQVQKNNNMLIKLHIKP